MNGLVFYIGLGLGLALAAGLRPFLPALLAGALGSAGDLGVSFTHSGYAFLQSDWWLLALAVAFVAAWALQLILGVTRLEAGPLGAALAGLGVGVGAVLFAGTLGAHGDASWAGLVGGAAAAALVGAAIRPILSRVRTRLPDRGAREAVTLYVDATALLLAALVALLHPLGYLALIPFAWLLLGERRRAGEKYAGLRILGR
jgi:CDP-diglyceride synthetase